MGERERPKGKISKDEEKARNELAFYQGVIAMLTKRKTQILAMQDLDPEEKSIMAQLDYYGWLLDKHAEHFDDLFPGLGLSEDWNR